MKHWRNVEWLHCIERMAPLLHFIISSALKEVQNGFFPLEYFHLMAMTGARQNCLYQDHSLCRYLFLF
jgi:hypothetical protein